MSDYKNHLSSAAVENLERWLSEPKYSEYKSELQKMIDGREWQKLEDAFFKIIEFGTGGRRGVVGVGSNRINRVTIGESAQALCKYAAEFDPEASQKGIVIACDTRNSSPELSQYAAMVCAANGFKTYIFDEFRSTPELSFAVRHLGCAAGIVISASHNPPADNGFKAYWSDGAQIVAPHDQGVLDAAADITEVNSLDDFEQAVSDGKIEIIGREVDEAYFEAATAEVVGKFRDLEIVFSPLHGTGQTNTLPILKKAGFDKISVVEEQMLPDGNFPTIPTRKPNPEEEAANDMAVKKMMSLGADIAITNDPDADRVGVIVNHQSKPFYLSGNQAAALAADYALMKLKESGELSQDHYLVKTIVTTDMMSEIAKKYGAKIYDNLLVGFKYVGEVIRSKEGTAEKFVLGAEESFGLLKGDYARDKDGASGALILAEYAAELKSQGKTLVDRLFEIYEELGLFVETLETTYYEGADGFSKMQKIMSSLREDPPKSIGDNAVSATLDYKTLTRTEADGSTSKIDSIFGDVFVVEFGDLRRRVTIRPSGTEPKLKIYMQWWQETSDLVGDYAKLEQELKSIYEELSKDALRRIEA